jgi:hypothetical protein
MLAIMEGVFDIYILRFLAKKQFCVIALPDQMHWEYMMLFFIN